MPRLMIVQPYVPAYRVPFFRSLRPALADQGVELVLAACLPQGSASGRGDDATAAEADLVLTERRISLAGKSLGVRRLKGPVRELSPDFVVVEQAIKNFEVYPLLARSGRGKAPKVAMWGQGRTYSTQQSSSEASFKQWLTRRADWFFAYTQEGADYVAAHGFDARRVTVLLNSTDTVALRAELDCVDDAQVDAFRAEHGLTPGATALFMGGVDPAKGIEFLLDAACRAAQQVPGFRLLVAGEGISSGLVRARQQAGDPIVALGRVEGRQKALALRASDLMMIPQWVGLIAVDSLAAGVPIVTTRHPSHSPEFAYLVDDRNAVVTEHDVAAYASGVVSLLCNPGHLNALREQAQADAADYSVEGMALRFAHGVLQWRERPVG